MKHVQRAQIVLASADHLPVLEVANRVGVSRPMVWRSQQRYAEEGLEGLLRDKTRPPSIPPVPQAKVHAVVERTLRAPPGAVVLEGKVIGRCVPRHRKQEFIGFITTVEQSVPPGKVIHAILDNYAAHKHPEVLAWLAAHPRWTFHFTPTSCSWLNAVEGFLSRLTRQSLKRDVFRSVDDFEKAIARYVAATNKTPTPPSHGQPPQRQSGQSSPRTIRQSQCNSL